MKVGNIRSGVLWMFLISTLGIFSFNACERENASDVNQNKIYTDYEQFYNKNTDKTVVVARFRFGGVAGTLLELDSTAFVTFNGDTLPYSVIYSGHAKEYAGQIAPGTFSYTNINNATFTNQVPTFESIDFPIGFDTIVKSQANTLTWAGTPLAPDQNVGLFIGSWTWGQDALYFQDGDGANDLILGMGQLASVPVGPAICYLDRATDKAVAQGTPEGGRIRGKFRALNRQVQVVQ
jgi:hypothetical protein